MGLALPKPVLSKVIERKGNDIVASGVCSINGHRNSMEDSHAIETKGTRTFLGVFDGHGSDQCSAFISKHLPPLILGLESLTDKTALENVCLQADKDCAAAGKEGGTTGTFIILNQPDSNGTIKATVANVGDSRVLIVRQNGSSLQIAFATEDHKPTNQDERTRITRAGGQVRMGRVDGDLAVSRAFGDFQFKGGDGPGPDPRNTKVVCVPDITEIELRPDDWIVVACDGVFEGNFSNEDVAQFIENVAKAGTTGGDYGTMAAKICDQAVRRGSKDNITCMVSRVGNEGAELVAKFGHLSFVPGPLYLPEHKQFVGQWAKMAEAGNTKVRDALDKRERLVIALTDGKGDGLPPCELMAMEMSDPADAEAEISFFKTKIADSAKRDEFCGDNAGK